MNLKNRAEASFSMHARVDVISAARLAPRLITDFVFVHSNKRDARRQIGF